MALSEDQRALLRLLLEGGTYEQIAELLGTSGGDVRARAHDAATEVAQDPAEADFAAAVRTRLGELDGGETAPRRAAAPERGGSGWRSNRPLLAAVAAGLVALVAVFVVIQATGDSGETTTQPTTDQEDVVVVKMNPVGGSGAQGTVRIVRVEDLPAVDLDITGLKPNRPGETYVLWLLASSGQGVPIAFRDVGPDGRFTGRTQIPSAAAGLLPSLDFIDVSVARDRQAAAAVRAAAQSSTLPQHVGTTVVRGNLHG